MVVALVVEPLDAVSPVPVPDSVAGTAGSVTVTSADSAVEVPARLDAATEHFKTPAVDAVYVGDVSPLTTAPLRYQAYVREGSGERVRR